MSQKKILAVNWKMNPLPKGFDAPKGPYRSTNDVTVIVFPTALDIDACVAAKLTVGGQYGRAEEKGSFTGDVSMAMLKERGCTYVICGHSERRQKHGETLDDVHAQMLAASEAGLIPILCIGETANDRDANKTEQVVHEQLLSAIDGLSGEFIIAYEPAWAIGTGTAEIPTKIEAMHTTIRSWLPKGLREETPLIYGASVKPENAEAIFACPTVDGALVGIAALQPSSFQSIVDALHSSPL